MSPLLAFWGPLLGWGAVQEQQRGREKGKAFLPDLADHLMLLGRSEGQRRRPALGITDGEVLAAGGSSDETAGLSLGPSFLPFFRSLLRSLLFFQTRDF